MPTGPPPTTTTSRRLSSFSCTLSPFAADETGPGPLRGGADVLQRVRGRPGFRGCQFLTELTQVLGAHRLADLREPVLLFFLDVMADVLDQDGYLRGEPLVGRVHAGELGQHPDDD